MKHDIPIVLGLSAIIAGDQGETLQKSFLLLVIAYILIVIFFPDRNIDFMQMLITTLLGYFIKDAETRVKEKIYKNR